MNKKAEALVELNKVEKLNPSLDEEFIIYKYKKLIEEFGDKPSHSNSSL